MDDETSFGVELVLFLLSFPLLSGEFVGLGTRFGIAPAALRTAGVFLLGAALGVAFQKLSE